MSIAKYLKTLIIEKGKDTEDFILEDEGNIGLTYQMLIDFIESVPKYHATIRNTLVMIDFKNGNVFHYLDHLARGMVKASGY